MTIRDTGLTIVRGSVFLFIGRGLANLLDFFTRIVLARWLGAADFGVLALVTMLIGIVLSVFRLGIGGSLTRFVAQASARKEDVSIVSSSAFVILLPAGIIASLLVLVLAEPLALHVFRNANAVVPFRIAAMAILLLMLRQVFALSIAGFQRFGYTALSNVIADVFTFISTLLLLYLGYALVGAVWALILGILAGTIATFLFFSRLTRIRLTSVKGETAKALLRFSAPLYGTDIIGSLYLRAPVFLIGYFLTSANVGYYAVAMGLSELLLQYSGLLQTVIFPTYAKAHALGDQDTLRGVFNRAMKYTLYVFIPFAVGGFLLARPLVAFIYGSEYLPGSLVLQVLIFSVILLVLANIARDYLVAVGKPGFTLKVTVLATVICILLSVVLIPTYGIVGAAIALLASRVSDFVFSFFSVARRMKLSLGFLPRSLVASGVMALFVYFQPITIANLTTLIMVVLLAAVVYFVILFVARGFDQTDKRLCREFLASLLAKHFRYDGNR